MNIIGFYAYDVLIYIDYHPYEDYIRTLHGVSKLRAYLQMVRIVDTRYVLHS